MKRPRRASWVPYRSHVDFLTWGLVLGLMLGICVTILALHALGWLR